MLAQENAIDTMLSIARDAHRHAVAVPKSAVRWLDKCHLPFFIISAILAQSATLWRLILTYSVISSILHVSALYSLSSLQAGDSADFQSMKTKVYAFFHERE
jgi:hypothetical protein